MINGSTVYINEIGTNTEAPQSAVMCTSDRMPCCRPQHGEWTFPNGSLVQPRNQNPTTFVRTRDYNGNVHLFRVNSSMTVPTGRFCCEVEDATGTNQIQCVNIICK